MLNFFSKQTFQGVMKINAIYNISMNVVFSKRDLSLCILFLQRYCYCLKYCSFLSCNVFSLNVKSWQHSGLEMFLGVEQFLYEYVLYTVLILRHFNYMLYHIFCCLLPGYPGCTGQTGRRMVVLYCILC